MELLKEEPTIKIASKYNISVQTLNKWKNRFLENASLAFNVGEATKKYKEEIKKLEEKNKVLAKTLGKTTIDRDWTVEKLKSLNLSNKGFIYMCTIIDWYFKAVFVWKILSTMDTVLTTQTLKEAIEKHRTTEIFNSDQGSQYISREYTDLLKKYEIKISINGKGRNIDNIAIERFFRTFKYKEIYMKEYYNVKELKESIQNYIHFYNYYRYYLTLNYKKSMNILNFNIILTFRSIMKVDL